MLSIIASTVPFADYNQSPRNMYQCQMAKQTMGTPYHNHPYRMDNKVYRLLFPQKPIVATETADKYDFSQYPSGTNAVVAVISYTGYDMEDAMIINKSAYERGFGHGCVYKSFRHDLNEATGSSQ
jgi:DNA-directed RNA polymerase I subunit RPA2